MPLSMTPGSSIIASPELRCRHGLRRDLSSSALPILPAIRFTRGKYFGASRFTHLLRPAKLLAPLYGSDRHARPSRAFTSRLPTDRLPSPLLDMTTTATGLLCWRDSHPLEWQLASLHQNRTHALQNDARRAAMIYSITLSARKSSAGGTTSPMDAAVLRLKTSSKIAGCSTGRSAGAVPRRTLASSRAIFR